jgi:hypothetical protein
VLNLDDVVVCFFRYEKFRSLPVNVLAGPRFCADMRFLRSLLCCANFSGSLTLVLNLSSRMS